MSKIKIKDEDRAAAQNLEIRSDELKDILGLVPKWIVRYGTMVIVTVFLVLLIGSSILKYPDVLNAKIKLTTEIPPAELTANTSARISNFFVADKDTVKSTQVLLTFESAAAISDVMMLQIILNVDFSIDTLLNIEFSENLALGEIQVPYANFLKKIKEYRSFINLNYYQRKIASLQSEQKKYSSYTNVLKEQDGLLKKEYILVEKQYKRDSLMHEQQVLSAMQFEKSESGKLKTLFEWKQTQNQLAAIQIEESNLEQEILELELKLEENGRSHLYDLREAHDNLKGQIAIWMKKYVISSPYDGQVSFTKYWSENQRVEEGEIVMTVVPKSQGMILGRIELSAKGAGKVSLGNKVIIRFDNYPYMEFGTVGGTISSISVVPNDEIYSAEVRLDSNRLITNYNIDIGFQQNMPGNAEIITEERSLLRRIFAPFKSAIKRQASI